MLFPSRIDKISNIAVIVGFFLNKGVTHTCSHKVVLLYWGGLQMYGFISKLN